MKPDNTYVFGQNTQISKRLKIVSMFSKSELAYAFSNSNLGANSLKIDKKGEDIINSLTEKRDALQIKHNIVQSSLIAAKAALIEENIKFETSSSNKYSVASSIQISCGNISIMLYVLGS